jgi:hypothetical protein
MPERLRIAVTGLAATYPFGGVFWDYAQYLLGLSRLGHDVLYIEDTGKWAYDVVDETFVKSGGRNAARFAHHIAALEPDLADRWFFRDAEGDVFGRPWRDVAAFCRAADLFLHISASCWMRDEYFAAGRVAFIDSDPMYTQASVPDYVPGTAQGHPRGERRNRPSVVTIDQIRRRVADAFGTAPVALGPGSRTVAAVSPHEIAMYLASRLTHASPVEIGQLLGGRDQRSVLRAIATIHPLLQEDTVFGQAVEQVAGRLRVDILGQHDVFFTFAENIGAPDCRVPSDVFGWMSTRQPIVMDCFSGARIQVANRRGTLTTVASWESTEGGPTVDGVSYGGKNVEFERFIELPKHVSVPLELALSGRPPRERLAQHGWRLINPYEVSCDPWVYRRFLAQSSGEWSVAKNAYVASRSGWFSCRTACYLALGVPAVVQDTGFGASIPTGEGVLAFSTLDEAVDSIERLAGDPERHSRAAQALAAEYFDSNKVLTGLIERAMSATEPQTPGRTR